MKKIILLFFILFVSKPTLLVGKRKAPKKIVSKSENPNTILLNSKWLDVQKKAKDTVVQLFVQTSEFNWRQPYKTPGQDEAWGSGFFIDDEGHIISNYHVVDEAADVKIQIPSLGKKRFEAKIVGTSPARDLALLKLTEKSRKKIKEKIKRIPFLPLGDSDKVLRTHQVLALGYPLGQEKLKSTQGIVSGREHVDGESYIQITAAINSGNSGGPSLNTKGEVIGINTAGITSAQSVGYIIPINDVKSVIKDLHKEKLLRKPILGCEINKGTEELVAYFKNPKPGGLYISRVFKDTLFQKAGIKAGDMVYSMNDHTFDIYGETEVSWSEDKVPLISLLNRFKVGEKITVVFYRKGEKKETTFTFDNLTQLPIRSMYPEFEKIDYEVIGGMVVMQLSSNLVSIFDNRNPYLIKYRQRENRYVPRLIITHILPNSQTQQARAVYSGDLIEQINNQAVQTLNDFRKAVKKDTTFLSVKTDEKKFMTLSMKKIVEQEDELSKKYFYKKSNLVKELEKKVRRRRR